MAIKFESTMQGEVLLIRASGKDDNAEQVFAYGMAVIREAVRHGARLVLCDERELAYALDTFEIYQAAEELARQAPRVTRVAVVCHARYLADGKFWATVLKNRGMQVSLGSDIDKAWAWLRADAVAAGDKSDGAA